MNINHIVTAWETFAHTTAPDLVLEVPRTEEQYEALVAFADKLTSTYNCNDPEHAPLYDLVAFYIGEWEKVHYADILEGEVPPYRMLAYYLEQRGVSAYRVAKDTGIPQPTLSAVLAQRREVSKDVAKKLAAYFGVSTELFI